MAHIIYTCIVCLLYIKSHFPKWLFRIPNARFTSSCRGLFIFHFLSVSLAFVKVSTLTPRTVRTYVYNDYFPTIYLCNAQQYRLSYVIVINVFTTYVPTIMFVSATRVANPCARTRYDFRSYYVHTHYICCARLNALSLNLQTVAVYNIDNFTFS